MRSIRTLANSASGVMWKTLPLVLFYYFQVNEESHILVTFCLHYGLCLDFMSMLKIVILLTKNPQKGKIEVVTNNYEFMPLVYSRGNECAEILHGPALTSWGLADFRVSP